MLAQLKQRRIATAQFRARRGDCEGPVTSLRACWNQQSSLAAGEKLSLTASLRNSRGSLMPATTKRKVTAVARQAAFSARSQCGTQAKGSLPQTGFGLYPGPVEPQCSIGSCRHSPVVPSLSRDARNCPQAGCGTAASMGKGRHVCRWRPGRSKGGVRLREWSG